MKTASTDPRLWTHTHDRARTLRAKNHVELTGVVAGRGAVREASVGRPGVLDGVFTERISWSE
ncbi:MAG: hypothetical protein ACT4O5_16230 [Gammaproteobacteria bacterium]